jgi:transposase
MSARVWLAWWRTAMAAASEGVFAPAQVAAVHERLRHPPDSQDGIPQTRWTLRRVRCAVAWLARYSLSGVWRVLRRLHIRLRQGRPQLFSPDPAYQQKEERLLAVLREVAVSRGRKVVVFVDEFTLYHWPLLARDWCSLLDPPPIARRAPPGERRCRVVSGLEASSGTVVSLRAPAIGTPVFCRFLEKVAARFSAAERIFIVLDNWPVHHAPEVSATCARLSRLELVFLPTYAPWLNPIEKLWDALKDAVLRLHRRAGQWKLLRAEADAFLAHFALGSEDLLHRVGLRGDGKLAMALATDLHNQK